MLGLGRALGETMAVTFVIGNAYRISASLFEPGNSIASALANEFNEAADAGAPRVADRAGAGAVRADLHRARRSRAADRCASRAGEGTQDLRPNADRNPRLPHGACSVNRFNLVMSLATMAFGMAFLLWILCDAVRATASPRCRPTLFTQTTPPPGIGRRPAQRDLRQRADRRRCDADQHADRHPRRHLPRRIRQGRLARAARRASSTTSCCRRRRS